MATNLEILTSFITRQALFNQNTAENLIAIGINFNDWPEHFESRKVFEKFYKNLTEKNYKYAFWIATREGSIDKLEEIFGVTEFPNDPNALKIEYQKLLGEERANNLALKIFNDPKNASAFVDDYLNFKASDVVTISLEEAVEELFKSHEEARAQGKQVVGIPNWPILSALVGGFNPKRMGLLIADSGFGKTNLGVQLALHASETLNVLYINMEMGRDDFTQRFVASMMTMGTKDFHQSWDLGRVQLQAKTKKIRYTLGKDLSLLEIASIMRHHKKKYGLDLCIVDYDQKIVLKNTKEEWRELQQAAVFLESLSKELDCYVLEMAQSNLDGGISGSKRAQFPASHVFLFEKYEDDTIVRAVKNRFGKRNAAVRVSYDAEKAQIKEQENFIWTDPVKKSKGTFKKRFEKEVNPTPISKQQETLDLSYEV